MVSCQKVFSDHTIFVAHYLACVQACNSDSSSPLSFDVPQQYHICQGYFSNLLSFSKHVKVCAADIANTYGFKTLSIV